MQDNELGRITPEERAAELTLRFSAFQPPYNFTHGADR